MHAAYIYMYNTFCYVWVINSFVLTRKLLSQKLLTLTQLQQTSVELSTN